MRLFVCFAFFGGQGEGSWVSVLALPARYSRKYTWQQQTLEKVWAMFLLSRLGQWVSALQKCLFPFDTARLKMAEGRRHGEEKLIEGKSLNRK